MLAMSRVFPGCLCLFPLHKGMRGLGACQGRGEGTEDRERWQTTLRLQMLSPHPSNAARVWGAARPVGYRAHHCSPNLPQPARCRRAGKPFPSSWQASSTPKTHYSEMASANTACIHLPLGNSPSWSSCTTQKTGSTGGGAACVPPPPACCSACMCKGCIYTWYRGVPEPVGTCTHPAGKAITHGTHIPKAHARAC